MSDDFYASMYGAAPKSKSVSTPDKPSTPAVVKPAYQRLSGLKLTNSHMHEIEVDGRPATIPSAAYVKLLEDQIKELRLLLRNQSETLRRTNNLANKLQNELIKMNNKIDSFDDRYIRHPRGK